MNTMLEIKTDVTIDEILEDYANCNKDETNLECQDCRAYEVCPLLTRYKEMLKEGINDLIDKYII